MKPLIAALLCLAACDGAGNTAPDGSSDTYPYAPDSGHVGLDVALPDAGKQATVPDAGTVVPDSGVSIPLPDSGPLPDIAPLADASLGEPMPEARLTDGPLFGPFPWEFHPLGLFFVTTPRMVQVKDLEIVNLRNVNVPADFTITVTPEGGPFRVWSTTCREGLIPAMRSCVYQIAFRVDDSIGQYFGTLVLRIPDGREINVTLDGRVELQ